jgi:hypothetical protein
MRFAVVALLSVFLFACKGDKGDRGDPGQTGFPAPNQTTIFEKTGTVGLGSVFLGRSLQSNSVVLVYLESASTVGEFVLLSFDASGEPWAEVTYPIAHVQFHNCLTTSRYKILVIDPE